MKKKLNCILLVDDNEITNYLHQTIIEDADCANHIAIACNGQEAIDFLSSKKDDKYPKPELIFLDINMPIMNGWEFIEEYKNLSEDKRGDIITMMLTTSLNPDDQAKAEEYEEISGFKNKPFSIESLNEILMHYFPDRM